MALNTLNCNHLILLGLKGLNSVDICCRKAEQCKASGNKCYMSKDYAAAVRLYTEAIGEL